MEKGQCIYCKKKRNLSKEHAFPKSLLQTGVHEWIIDKHLCIECNTHLGNQLDGILTNASPIGFVWNGIKGELGMQTKDQQATFYRKPKSYGIHPVRLFFPDPLRDNRIVLHEEKRMSSHTEDPVDQVTALSPQIILTQFSKEQTFEEAVTEDCEKFNNPNSDEKITTKCYEYNKVYYNFGNTFIFPPETTVALLRKAKQRREFKSKFLTKSDCINFRIICSRQHNLHGSLEVFFKFLKSEEQRMMEQEKKSKSKPIMRIIRETGDSKAEPRTYGAIRRLTQAITDPKAGPYTYRAIAKIAFHCFLFHCPAFSGHESIFDDIKDFIYTGSPNRFVADWKNPGTENLVYSSTEHKHFICFFVHSGGIGCMVNLFTGLLTRPFTYWINLAGKFDNSIPQYSYVDYVPFYVHPNSQRKRRIHPASNLRLVQQPSSQSAKMVLRFPTDLL